MKTEISLNVGSEKIYFEISIDDIFDNNCRFRVTSLDNHGILFGGYVSNGYYGHDIIRKEVFFFQNWLDKKVKSELRKAKIKFKTY